MRMTPTEQRKNRRTLHVLREDGIECGRCWVIREYIGLKSLQVVTVDDDSLVDPGAIARTTQP